jgi:ribosome maturation factor RimP
MPHARRPASVAAGRSSGTDRASLLKTTNGLHAHFFLRAAPVELRDGEERSVARITAELMALVDRTVAGLGCELVDLERVGHGLLRVTLDAPTPGGIGLDDCERVSRQLTHLFAVEGVDYDRLEVSSPGLDRPLRGARDFARFVGAEVALQLFAPHDGRRRLRGTVLASGGEPGAEWVRLQESPPPVAVPAKGRRAPAKKKDVAPLPVLELRLADIDRARLVPQVDFGSKARAKAAPVKECSE